MTDQAADIGVSTGEDLLRRLNIFRTVLVETRQAEANVAHAVNITIAEQRIIDAEHNIRQALKAYLEATRW